MKRTCLALFAAVVLSACGAPEDSSSILNGQYRQHSQQDFLRKDGQFPQGPHEDVTPGTVCSKPESHRYPEKINYCDRRVASETKKIVIQMYDEKFGYTVGQMNRGDFKIDHYIPLCMGGGNEQENLWPQHRSVYEITDPLEPRFCELMAKGKMKQQDAISLIKEAKNDLNRAPEILADLEAQLEELKQ